MDKEHLTPDVAFNVLAKRHRFEDRDGKPLYAEECGIPMWGAPSRHSYVPLELTNKTHFSRTHLHKLRRQFFHPSAEKLHNLLRRSGPDQTTPDIRKIHEDLTKQCDPC